MFFEEKMKIFFVTKKDCGRPYFLCSVKRKQGGLPKLIKMGHSIKNVISQFKYDISILRRMKLCLFSLHYI